MADNRIHIPDGFEAYTKNRKSNGRMSMEIRLTPTYIYLGPDLLDMMGDPGHVMLYYNRRTSQVGMLPLSGERQGALKVTRRSSSAGGSCSAQGLLRSNGIEVPDVQIIECPEQRGDLYVFSIKTIKGES